MSDTPRIFWLDLASRYGDPCDFVSEEFKHKHPAATNIKVIEYAAFEKQSSQLKELVEALEEIAVWGCTPTETAIGSYADKVLAKLRDAKPEEDRK